MSTIRYSDHVEIPVKTNHAIIRISGGADSALLLYLMCDAWTKEKPNEDNHFYPISVIQDYKPWNPFYADQVIDWVGERFPNITIHPVKTRFCENPGAPSPDPRYRINKVAVQEQLIDEVVAEVGEVCQVFNGVTANPPIEYSDYWKPSDQFGDVWNEMREPHRDWEVRLDKSISMPKIEMEVYAEDNERNLIHCSPFVQAHKGHVADLYKEYELLDELLPLTRSCEGSDFDTNGFTTECGVCWWCYERKWAFEEWLKRNTVNT
jgi:hypothetical protein